MADDGLDYDDLISQNILIRREEKADSSATVEVLKKQNDDYENLYQKQAEIYQMDVELHGYVETDVKENYESDDDKSTTDSSDYEVVVQPAKRELSPNYAEYSSSDSDWEVQKKPKAQKGMYQCDECDKKWSTTRGLLVHKRAHARAKLREQQMQQPEEEVVVQPDIPVKAVEEEEDGQPDSPAEADEPDLPVEEEEEDEEGPADVPVEAGVEGEEEDEEEEEAGEEEVAKPAD